VPFARSLALCVLICGALPALAQDKLSQNTIMLLAGESRWLAEANTITNELTHENGLKLLAVQGNGCVESAADIMQLSSIDAGVVTADCVQYAKAQGLLPATENDMTYVSRLATLPIYIITKRDNKTLTSLAGQRIATGPAHSAIFATGELLLGGMGLPFQRIPKSDDDALALLAQGQADAVLMLGALSSTIELDPGRFHIIGLSTPIELANDYATTLMPQATLQGLSAFDVETIATPLLLVTRQTKTSSDKMKSFVSAFINLQATSTDAPTRFAPVNGWKRNLSAAQELKQRKLEPGNNSPQGEGS
jgi:TRAP-type uncharacterized transport system substrate-binding protein